MHKAIFRVFEAICRDRNISGRVLEVGAAPKPDTLLMLPSLRGASERVGINLEGESSYDGFRIVGGNANSMTMFESESFDAVVCNATLEHDPFFWLSIAEMKRVLKTGGVMIIGVPGYDVSIAGRAHNKLCRILKFPYPYWFTLTLRVHNEPGDYYRFTRMTVRDVFFGGMSDVKVASVMTVPRIVGSGIK